MFRPQLMVACIQVLAVQVVRSAQNLDVSRRQSQQHALRRRMCGVRGREELGKPQSFWPEQLETDIAED